MLKRKHGELSSAAPAVNKEHYEDNKDEIKKKQKIYYEENKDEIKKKREENKDKMKEYKKAYRELADVQNAERNAELTNLMHAGSDGAGFRPFKAPEVVLRKKQILKKKRAIFDGMSLAEAIKSKKFAL